MSEQTSKLIQLIKEQKTCNDIAMELGISNKQLYNNLTNLKNKGLNYKRKYYCTGDIIYIPISSLSDLKSYRAKYIVPSIITENKMTKLKCVAISDLHFGNRLERLDLLDRVFNYCIKNDIHIIFCCGDMIDGTFTKGIKQMDDVYEQIDYFIKKYPFDKNILTFAVGGDHDFSALYNNGQDIVEIINNYRHDIVINGYNNATVNIKNDTINLFHYVMRGRMLCDSSIILSGHSHKFGTKMIDNILHIQVPSLSNINETFPTALELDLQFNKGFIDNVLINQIYFDDKDYILNSINYNLLENKKVEIRPIDNEEKILFQEDLKIDKENHNKVLTKLDKVKGHYLDV